MRGRALVSLCVYLLAAFSEKIYLRTSILLHGLKITMILHIVCENQCVLLMACAKYTTTPGQSKRDTAIWWIWFPNFIFWTNNKGISKIQLWSQNLFYFRFLHYLFQILFLWYFSLDSSLFNSLLHVSLNLDCKLWPLGSFFMCWLCNTNIWDTSWVWNQALP